MKGLTKWIIIAVFLIFCIQAVSAFGVETITVDPSGSLTPGTPVIVTFKVDLSASGAETFPSSDELDMSTDLDKPTWTYSLVLDGVDTPQPSNTGRVLAVTGWILAYPSTVEESMKVTVQGTAPTVAQTSNKTMIKIQEVDSHNNIIASSVVERTAVVVNVAEVQTKVTNEQSALQTFRSHIDEKSALGVDTAEAEAKYSAAQQQISTASTLPSTQYLQALTCHLMLHRKRLTMEKQPSIVHGQKMRLPMHRSLSTMSIMLLHGSKATRARGMMLSSRPLSRNGKSL